MAGLLARIRAFLNPPAIQQQASKGGMKPPALQQIGEIQDAIRASIRASYDTISRTPENIRHFQWVDFLSADAAAPVGARKMLRAQARYEVLQNNSYGVGIVNSIANDTIGTGPRIQMELPSEKANKEIEAAWKYWATAVDLKTKLVQLRKAKMVDGAGLARFTTNLTNSDPVSVDIKVIEIDHLTSPHWLPDTPIYTDGIHFDSNGDPTAYDLLKNHPGSNSPYVQQFEYSTYPASQVIHWFRKDRPQQHHGVTEFAAALPLFAMLRRFTLATLSAAETAANVSQVVETDAPVPEELEAEYATATFSKYMEAIPIDRNSATVLPNQWKLRQFAAEHPTTTYKMFKAEILAEIGRCILYPRGLVAGDFSDFNFASGRLDHLPYVKIIGIDQCDIDANISDRIFAEFLIEAALSGIFSQRTTAYILGLYDQFGMKALARRVPHTWAWDGFEEGDQKAYADSQKIRLANGTTHRQAEYQKQGLNVDVEDAKAAKGYGVTVQQYRQMVGASIFSNGNAATMQQDTTQNDNKQTKTKTTEPTTAAS